MAYVGTGAIFRDNQGNDVQVASYFNRRLRKVQAQVVSGGVVTATTFTLVGSGLSMLCWADESFKSIVYADLSNTVSSQWVQVANAWNNGQVGKSGWYQAFTNNALGSTDAVAACDTLAAGSVSPAEGLVSLRCGFWVSGGQGNLSAAYIYAETQI
jgi:hypothetical protein